MEIGTGGETNVVNEVTSNEFLIKLVSSSAAFWWKDLKISKDNKSFIATDDKLGVIANYEMVQMIDAYHSYVLYHDNLVKAVYNKPLSIASLNIVNNDNILSTIERLEKDLMYYRKQILDLEDKIIDKIKTYIENNKLILIEDGISYKINKLFNIFKFSKHNNVLEQSLNVTYEQVKLKKD